MTTWVVTGLAMPPSDKRRKRAIRYWLSTDQRASTFLRSDAKEFATKKEAKAAADKFNSWSVWTKLAPKEEKDADDTGSS